MTKILVINKDWKVKKERIKLSPKVREVIEHIENKNTMPEHYRGRVIKSPLPNKQEKGDNDNG